VVPPRWDSAGRGLGHRHHSRRFGLLPSSSWGVLRTAYDLELFGDWSILIRLRGVLGAFPVLTSAYAQTSTITWSAAVLALAAALLSAAQRNLSNPSVYPSSVTSVEGEIRFADGTVRPIDRDFLIVRPSALFARSRSR